MTLRPTSRVLLWLALLTLAAAPAHGVDGVLEINQAKVNGSGGFPFPISQPGSYRLTSNLNVSSPDTDGILITADNVTLDLNGFTISAPNTGTSVGIYSSGGNVWIVNGNVFGFASSGIWIADGGGVEGVHVVGSGGQGIRIQGPYSVVRNCLVASSYYSGITTSGGIVTESSSLGNGGHGIQVFGASLVSANRVSLNEAYGISAQDGTVVGNTIATSGSEGIGCGNSAVIGNTITDNGGYGLSFWTIGAYGNNVITGNTVGTVSAGTPMGINLCNGSTTCP